MRTGWPSPLYQTIEYFFRYPLANSLFVAILFTLPSLVAFAIAFYFPKVRQFFLATGFFILIAGIFDIYSNQFPEWFIHRGLNTPNQQHLVEPINPCVTIACGTDTPEEIIAKMDCGSCHQIPYRISPTSGPHSGHNGPLLIEGTTAVKRLGSHAYQAQVRSRRAHAKTPKEYIIEAIVAPNVFINPEFSRAADSSQASPMPSDYGEKFTYAALDKLADYLLTLDCKSAEKTGLEGPPEEPRSKLCGE
jgi:hypothetical protein